ncbi:hypothetical protein LB505_012859 [Fusarium chuoi]|nr:hypothetical protein LB505_012859 [Fusarium chuoi]
MRCSQALSVFGALFLTTVTAVSLPAGVPRDITEFRDKHPYTPPKHEHRKIVRIRASKNDTDDVSDEFKRGLQEHQLHRRRSDCPFKQRKYHPQEYRFHEHHEYLNCSDRENLGEHR